MYPPEGHNRMRHVDFRKLFEGLGFEVLQDVPRTPFDLLDDKQPSESSEQLLKELEATPISPDFARYTIEELAVLDGFWVLRTNNTANVKMGKQDRP